jgi:hypothetical protein
MPEVLAVLIGLETGGVYAVRRKILVARLDVAGDAERLRPLEQPDFPYARSLGRLARW